MLLPAPSPLPPRRSSPRAGGSFSTPPHVCLRLLSPRQGPFSTPSPLTDRGRPPLPLKNGAEATESARIFVDECGLNGLLAPEQFLEERESMLQELFPSCTALPDLLEKVWGLDRLIAYCLHGDLNSPSDMRFYESYLEKFYDSNDHYQSKKADVIFQCLQKEKDLSSAWKAKSVSRRRLS